MYQIFDFFLDHPDSWHRGDHWSDEENFYRALNEVARRPEFNPTEMRRHFEATFRQQHSERELPTQALAEYEHKAEVVVRFLRAVERFGQA